MGKWIASGALIAWAGIVALAYKLGTARIDICYGSDCRVAATSLRDGILIFGLSVGLIGCIVLAVLVTRSRTTPGRRATNPAPQSRLN